MENHNILYSQIKTELKVYNQYPELKKCFKADLLYAHISWSISKKLSSSVIPEFINVAIKSLNDSNKTYFIISIIVLQKLNELYNKELCNNEILTNQISLGLLNVINAITINTSIIYKKIETFAPRVQKLKILAYIEEKSGELFGIAFLMGFLCKESQKKIMKWPLVKQAGIAFGVCHFIINEYNTESSIFKLYYTRNEIIDLFSEKIDMFRELSIKTHIHNQFLEDKYNEYLEIFKTIIKLVK